MPKSLVLDTNVLLHDVNCLEVFEEHEVIIHSAVIYEIDKKKNEEGHISRNARIIASKLLGYALEGDITQGVVVNKAGGILKIAGSLPPDKEPLSTDDFLMSYTQMLKHQGQNAVLVTKDKLMRLKALTCKVPVEDYKFDRVEETYDGHVEQLVAHSLINTIYKEKELSLYEALPIESVLSANFLPNQCVTLTSNIDPKSKALCVIDSKVKNIKLISTINGASAAGIKPLNAEQRYAMHLLLDPNIHLVTINGATGSGKTLLPLASGIQQQEESLYEQVIVTRKEVAVSGNKTPFLPGDVQEKAGPWLKCIFSCLNKIARHHVPTNRGLVNQIDRSYEFFTSSGIVVAEPLDYVRGTTFDGFVLLDEAQNFHKDELKTLVTRAGKNCKVVICGDVGQIDTRFLDRYSNGLAIVIDRFKGWEHYAHITLKETVRSELAKEAEQRLWSCWTVQQV